MITYKLKINFQDSKILQSDIEMVSGDVGAYRLECAFYDNGKRVDISDCLISLKAKRSDGVILSEGGRVLENTGIIDLKNSIYSVPGELYLEIALADSAKNYVTTKIIMANVYKGLGETEETATSQSSVYVTLLGQMKTRIDELGVALSEVKSIQGDMDSALDGILALQNEFMEVSE